MINKIVPALWFCFDEGKISGVLNYYRSVFGNDFEHGEIISLGDTPSGYAEMCEVSIFGQTYNMMSTANEHHSFNDALTFIINCENQTEIDTYWNYFTKDGKDSQCGWCVDKFGLKWQVIPKNLGELMSRPNAFEVMMSQTKIVIEEYLVD